MRFQAAFDRPSPARALFARRLIVLVLASCVSAAVPATADDAASSPAPTKLHAQPILDNLITLPGDFATMRYGVGSLDRAARLQYQLQELLRIFERWSDVPMPITVYVLTRDEWRQGRINMTYGLPVRIGQSGLAVPARGDDQTARFWQQLAVPLPSGTQTGFRTSGADHTPSLAMADLIALHQVGEMLIDRLGLAGDEHWVRGLVTHVVTLDYLQRHAERAALDLEVIYRQVLDQRAGRPLAASDYRAVMPMGEWLWFQARFHDGAEILLDDEGRGALKKLSRLARRNDGVLAGDQVLDRWDDLLPWYQTGFSTVSTRPLGR